MKFSLKTLASFFIGCLFFAASLHGQAALSIQGVVKNSDGTAVDNGNYSITFKLYTAETGGSNVWNETQPSVKISGGIYSTILGTVNPLTAAFNQTYFLGVSVEGGAELQPRTKLTSAPYALSLIGQTNIFPSTGAVGVGTTSPSASYKLDVNGAANVSGTLNVSSISSGNGINLYSNNQNLYVYRDGSEKLRVDGGGIYVTGGITATGTINGTLNGSAGSLSSGFNSSGGTFTSEVLFNGSASQSGNYGFLNSAGTTGSINGTGSYSVNCANRVKASEFNAYSDRRIKKDFRLANNGSDLEILKKLRVTDYRHIDEVAKGMASKKGFIAQEVEAIFPEAVTKTPDFIPNLYEKAVSVNLDGEKLTVFLDKNHGLKTGDEVRLMLPDGKKELVVASISDEKTFTVGGWKMADAAPEWVFAWGKKVDDFRTVDYDRIHTLNVSATQELARRVELLEKENADLRSKNESLRADLGATGSRLQLLETAVFGKTNAAPTGQR